MKKITLAAIAALLILCLSGCAASGDFRYGKWGQSPKKISGAEPTEFVYAADDIVEFIDEAYGKESEILYIFNEDGLCEGQIKFLVGDWILEDIIADYEQTAAAMTEEFGAPLESDYRVWLTDKPEYEEHKDDGEVYAMFYKVLEYKLEWNDGVSRRTLALNYKDEQINYIYNAYKVES